MQKKHPAIEVMEEAQASGKKMPADVYELFHSQSFSESIKEKMVELTQKGAMAILMPQVGTGAVEEAMALGYLIGKFNTAQEPTEVVKHLLNELKLKVEGDDSGKTEEH